MLIRKELPGDYQAIRDLNRSAFGGDVEARLVDQLRKDGDVILSLVALDHDGMVGHVLFSNLVIETENGVIPAASLAPMCVLPSRQRSGIGSRLVRAGLTACKDSGKHTVILLGHPEYYPRFGFSAAVARNLESPYSKAGNAWIALELVPGCLSGVHGTVRYPKAFSALDEGR